MYVCMYLAVWDLSCSMWTSWSMWNLVPWPGIDPQTPALGAWNLTHWTTREVPGVFQKCGSMFIWMYMWEQKKGESYCQELAQSYSRKMTHSLTPTSPTHTYPAILGLRRPTTKHRILKKTFDFSTTGNHNLLSNRVRAIESNKIIVINISWKKMLSH